MPFGSLLADRRVKSDLVEWFWETGLGAEPVSPAGDFNQCQGNAPRPIVSSTAVPSPAGWAYGRANGTPRSRRPSAGDLLDSCRGQLLHKY